MCQWLAGPVSSDPASLGMGAPVPLSWESVKPAPLIQSGLVSIDPARPEQAWRQPTVSAVLLRATREVALPGRQERLLWWGRLLLEGG